MLAEKIVTAINLGLASTRVRDWSDIYTLSGRHPVGYAPTREAVLATARFRGVALVLLSQAADLLVDLRSQTHTAYRRGLGPDGLHLPEPFADVVEAVIVFGGPLIAAHQLTRWSPEKRRWEP
ncbi:MAG: nucleotidyl transferase AbiEii/AbiGii toxin family protein [Bifidobacteriaceae bacterium]|nr:nucleotidyl transferase AbiEii/AbiGii toxin family protein [Bifidobacteriaceae bacterium]